MNCELIFNSARNRIKSLEFKSTTVHDVVHSFVENVVQAMAEVGLPLLLWGAAVPLPDVPAELSQATS